MERLYLKNDLINGTVLKIFALICMTVDHIGLFLLNNNSYCRAIGRLAFPLFAYFIAEGCFYTKNRKKYLLKIAIFGIITQIIFIVFYRPLYFNVLITFTFSILIIYYYDSIKNENGVNFNFLFIFLLVFIFFLSEILPRVFYRTKYQFAFDYGFIGLCFPLFLYAVSDKKVKTVVFFLGLILLSVKHMGLQWFCLIDGVIILFYNGKRGKYSLKYLFYFYFPLHFLGIFLIKMIL